jgi:hypothetical protein
LSLAKDLSFELFEKMTAWEPRFAMIPHCQLALLFFILILMPAGRRAPNFPASWYFVWPHWPGCPSRSRSKWHLLIFDSINPKIFGYVSQVSSIVGEGLATLLQHMGIVEVLAEIVTIGLD